MISANKLVSVNPGVIGAGGNPLSLNAVIMSQSLLIPYGTVPAFGEPSAVSAYFGASSAEYAAALTYFQGPDNSTVKPGNLYFAPYAAAALAGWMQTGSFAGVTLVQLQAIAAGTLTLTVDGTPMTSSSINLSAASSFSNAATLIAAAFTGTGHPGVAWDAVRSVFVFTSTTTGASSQISVGTGAIATALKTTLATGAVVSPGGIIDTPTLAMDRVKAVTQNWVTFLTMWEPDLATKQLFAAWSEAQNQRFGYIAWDTDAQAIVSGSTTCFGAVAKTLAYNTVTCVYNTLALAVLTASCAASVDFGATNGRATLAYRGQSGLAPTVTDGTIADILLANGYSFYGIYATANQAFNLVQNGNMAGRWLWFDTFIGEIQLNSQMQLACMSLFQNVKSIPYNENGYSLIRAALADPIRAALNFGTIRAGVVLSAAQIAAVEAAAGLSGVGQIMQQQGYFLQIKDPGTVVRGQRGSPIINLWYCDGGAVQKISISSVAVL